METHADILAMASQNRASLSACTHARIYCQCVSLWPADLHILRPGSELSFDGSSSFFL